MVLLTLEETAARLNVSTRTVRRWIKNGKLPATRIPEGGRTIRIDEEDIKKLVSSCRT